MRKNKYTCLPIRTLLSKGRQVLFFICTFAQLQICTSIAAQIVKTDSMLTALKKSKEDTNKVNLLNAIARIA